jgi:hypothetical protein
MVFQLNLNLTNLSNLMSHVFLSVVRFPCHDILEMALICEVNPLLTYMLLLVR